MTTNRILIPAIAFAASIGALADARGELSIPRYTIDGGGGTSAAGSLSLTGTIGQPDASEALSGGTLQIVGGFWAGIGLAGDFDGDGDVDIDDYEQQYDCLTGPDGTAPQGCFTDMDGDNDIDLQDVSLLQDAFTTSGS